MTWPVEDPARRGGPGFLDRKIRPRKSRPYFENKEFTSLKEFNFN
jgi:hypothetical protein